MRAEALAMLGRTAEALALLDDFHVEAGLPPASDGVGLDEASVLTHVIEERRRLLFSQGGHRLRDLVRWRGTAFEIPFLGEPGSIHPDGVWLDPETGEEGSLQYGSDTCFPVPLSERAGGS